MNGADPITTDFGAGLDRLLADRKGAQRVMNTLVDGNLKDLPKLLEPYGLYPFPRDICITLVQVLQATIYTGSHSEPQWKRFPTPGPHRFDDPGGTLLTRQDIDRLQGKNLPPNVKQGYFQSWDYLSKRGYLVEGPPSIVPDYIRIDETRQMDICKSMGSNPFA